MKKNETKNILRMSLDQEESVVNNKDIGLDKFSKADKIFTENKINPQQVKSNPPGQRKTIYISQRALSDMKQIGSKLRLLDIGSNDSKIIAAALLYLNELNNEELIERFNKLEQS